MQQCEYRHACPRFAQLLALQFSIGHPPYPSGPRMLRVVDAVVIGAIYFRRFPSEAQGHCRVLSQTFWNLRTGLATWNILGLSAATWNILGLSAAVLFQVVLGVKKG